MAWGCFADISAVQFQAVRLACARHEKRMEDGSRGGFFLGDGRCLISMQCSPQSAHRSQQMLLCLSLVQHQLKGGSSSGPGVGKGRQISATIMNYFCQGKTKVRMAQYLISEGCKGPSRWKYSQGT